jgi:outer membrane scaffolding protein for murein synthesis (MipA/OmpV family)
MRATVTNNLGQVATVDVNVTVAAGLANLAVSVSPSFGSSASAPTGSPYSFGVSASSSNGSGPFTYSWAPSGRISPTNTSSATYTAPSNVPGTEFCLFTCTITDAVGRVGQQNGSVNITWF